MKNRIAELGIKQWWLAEQIGVDRKTVIRWIQGQVKSIQQQNAEKLAKILECSLKDLSLKNEAEQLATPEDQKKAAKLLLQSSLVDKLGPIGEWNVIESLLKATLVENLPLNILGDLYDQLTIASWRQSKIDQAEIYNAKTEEIAKQTGDQVLLASALLSKANIFSWKGKASKSISTYQECLELKKYIDPRKLGATYSNLGAVLYESGDIQKGEGFLKKSLEAFSDYGKPTNFSIAYCHLAIVALLEDKVDHAAEYAAQSIHFADLDSYRRGQSMGKLLQSEVAARRGQSREAQTFVTTALEEFEKIGILEGLNFEIAGRVHRFIGNLATAETLLRRGIEISQTFPIYLAALHIELAEVLRLSDSEHWLEEAQTGLKIYMRCECPLRANEVKKRFKIK